MKIKRGTKSVKKLNRCASLYATGEQLVDPAETSVARYVMYDYSLWRIETSPGDGHCLLHSILTSYTHQLQNHPMITLSSIKASLTYEIHDNSVRYLPFVENNSVGALGRGMQAFLVDRHYDQSFGDLVPMILANALGLQINIIDERDDGSLNEMVMSPEGGLIQCIHIHRRDEHFNGLIPAPNDLCAVCHEAAERGRGAVLSNQLDAQCRVQSHVPANVSSDAIQLPDDIGVTSGMCVRCGMPSFPSSLPRSTPVVTDSSIISNNITTGPGPQVNSPPNPVLTPVVSDSNTFKHHHH